MSETSITLHAAVTNGHVLMQSHAHREAQMNVAKQYVHGNIFKKILYFFADKEIYHAEYNEALEKQVDDSMQTHRLLDQEKVSYAHRVTMDRHIQYTTQSNDLVGKNFSHPVLTQLAQDYLLGKSWFAWLDNNAAYNRFVTEFEIFSMNNVDFSLFLAQILGKHRDYYVTDLLLQLTAYRANIQLTQTVLSKKHSVTQIDQLLARYVEHYQQVPLLLKMLDVDMRDPMLVQRIYSEEWQQLLQQLLQPVYAIALQYVEPTQPMGTITPIATNKRSYGYQSIGSWIGSWRQSLPFFLKLLLFVGIFALAARTWWWALIALPVLVFLRQYRVAKAQQKNAMHQHYRRIVTEWVTDSVWLYINKQTDAASLWSLGTQLTELCMLLGKDEHKKQDLQATVSRVLARLQYGYESGLSMVIASWYQRKEYEYMLLKKLLLLATTQLWYTLGENTVLTQYAQTIDFQEEYTQLGQSHTINRKKFLRASRLSALQDGVMSGVVTWLTWWLWSVLLPPTGTVTSVYVASAHASFIQHRGSVAYAADADTVESVIDESLRNSLTAILPGDIYDEFVQQLSDGTMQSTLRETLVGIAWYEQGNEYAQQLMDELRKAKWADWLSELFERSVDNGFPLSSTDITATQSWNQVEHLLNVVYKYEWLEAFYQHVDREWITSTMNWLHQWDISLEQFATDYTHEQRSVLSHAAFTFIKTDDLTDLFFDSELTDTIKDVVEDNVIQLRWLWQAAKAWYQTATWSGDFWLHATPLPYAQTRILPELDE